MRLVRCRVLALLAAFVLLLTGTAFGSPHYFCQMSGRVSADHCCGAGEGAFDASCNPKLSAADCCERVTPASGAQASRGASPVEAIQPAALTAILPELVYAFPEVVALRLITRQSRGPPLVGPPLFIAHCALLT